MAKRLSDGLSGFMHLVERQMLLHNKRSKLIRQQVTDEPKDRYQFITISRDIGALGNTIATETAMRLQWKVYDGEIVDYIAKHGNIRRNLVTQLDEKAQGVIHDTIGRWLSPIRGKNFSNDEYHLALINALATLAAQGRSIILGRGAAYALQNQPGLHVRITAPLRVRVQRLSEHSRISIKEARDLVSKTDEEKKNFIENHFKPRKDETQYFHLIFNTDKLTVDYVVAAILGIMEWSRQEFESVKPPDLERFAYGSAELRH